jgi:hypothetical protein
VVSADGLLGKDAKILLKKLSSLLAEKWEKSYSKVCGYVNARNHPSHTPLPMRVTNPDEPNEQPSSPVGRQAGLSLFRH